jgi:hypothetical protein
VFVPVHTHTHTHTHTFIHTYIHSAYIHRAPRRSGPRRSPFFFLFPKTNSAAATPADRHARRAAALLDTAYATYLGRWAARSDIVSRMPALIGV